MITPSKRHLLKVTAPTAAPSKDQAPRSAARKRPAPVGIPEPLPAPTKGPMFTMSLTDLKHFLTDLLKPEPQPCQGALQACDTDETDFPRPINTCAAHTQGKGATEKPAPVGLALSLHHTEQSHTLDLLELLFEKLNPCLSAIEEKTQTQMAGCETVVDRNGSSSVVHALGHFTGRQCDINARLRHLLGRIEL